MLKAFIREAECIGCSRCIPACPIDAIVGTHKYLHTVISQECIGCKLCIDPCPVDCIELIEDPNPVDKKELAANAKKRYIARQQRLVLEAQNQLPEYSTNDHRRAQIKQEIQDSLARKHRELSENRS